jgi:ubiquinone biosynthesis protein
LLALRAPAAPVDRQRLRLDLSGLVARYSGHAIGDLPVGAAITDILDMVRRHNLIISPDLALLFAVLVMDESITEQLDPDFRFEGALRPYAERRLASGLSPAVLARRAEQLGIEVGEMTAELPGQLHRLLETLADGQFEVHLRTSELQPLIHRVERLANRVAISILAAAAIDGLSELAAHNNTPGRGRRRPVIAAGIAVLTSLTTYARFRRYRPGARLDRSRRPS